MVNKLDINPKNIDGMFVVDSECIACNACVTDASLFFTMDEENSKAYVLLQPTIQEEIELCKEALDNCPVSAIHCTTK